jgi:hypothetical protein
MKVFKACKLLFFLLFIHAISYGQKYASSMKAGYGFYQGYHVGYSYFYDDNYSLGLTAGSHFGIPPFKYDLHYNLSIENTIHFGWSPRYVSKPWIFSQQAMYWVEGENPARWSLLSVYFSIGRIFGLSRNLGFSLEAGPSYNMIINVENDSENEIESWMWPIMFNGRVQIIYLFR